MSEKSTVGLDDSELENLAHSANQEALSFGVTFDVFMRLAKTVNARAAIAAAPAQPIMCQPPKSWNKRGQDAYRRGWEDRGNSVTSPADRYLEGCRDGYAQRDAEVMGALA